MFNSDAFYIALITFEIRSTIACQPTYYYLDITMGGGMKTNTTNPQLTCGKPLGKMVIDYALVCRVDSITTEDSESSLKVYTSYFDGLEEFKSECKWRKEKRVYICGTSARRVVFEFKGQLIKMEPLAKETKLESYVGCFDTGGLSFESTKAIYVESCESHCKNTTIYGLNKNFQCICIVDIFEWVPVNLELCNEVLDRHQIYGSKDYFSVYSKNKLPWNQEVHPSWECIHNLKDCPKCEDGRTGISCEIINCSINNGNCGEEMECQNITLWGHVIVAVCACKDGMNFDNDLQCKVRDYAKVYGLLLYIVPAVIAGLIILIILACVCCKKKIKKEGPAPPG